MCQFQIKLIEAKDCSKQNQNSKSYEKFLVKKPKNQHPVINLLEMNKSFLILTTLQKLEIKSLRLAQTYWTENCQFLKFDYSRLIEAKINLENLLNFTQNLKFRFESFTNQSKLNQFLPFLQQIEKKLGNNKLNIVIQFKSYENLDDLKIDQELKFENIKFIKLKIIDSKLTFSDSGLYPILKHFKAITLKDSFIGGKLMEDIVDYHKNLEDTTLQKLMRINDSPYSNVLSLRITDCIFVDSIMFSSLINLQKFKLDSSYYSYAISDLYDNKTKYKKLKSIILFQIDSEEYLKNKYLNNNDEFQECLTHDDDDFIDILSNAYKTYQYYEKIQTTLNKTEYQNMISTLSCFGQNKIDYCFYLNFRFDLFSELEPIFQLNFKSMTIFASEIALLDEDYLQSSQFFKLITKSPYELINEYYSQQKISMAVEEEDCIEDPEITLTFTKRSKFGEKIIKVNIYEFDSNSYKVILMKRRS